MRTFAVRIFGSRIEPMLLILPLKTLSGKSVQLDIGGFAQTHVGHVVFVDVANNPDVGQIRNSERVRRR